MQLSTQFDTKLAHGRRYEMAVSRWLQQVKGYHIMPIFDSANGEKAPQLCCVESVLTMPDIWGVKPGYNHLFEIKWKAKADRYRITNTLETGIPLHHWNDYRAVKQLTGMSIYLIFIHQTEQIVKYAELDTAPVSHIYDGSKMNPNGVIFFDFNRLKKLMALDQLTRYLEPQS